MKGSMEPSMRDTAAQAPSAIAKRLQALQSEQVRVLAAGDDAVVIIDRSPIVTNTRGEAHAQQPLHGLARLDRCGELQLLAPDVVRGRYRGALDEQAVQLEHYAHMRNGSPLRTVAVVRTVHDGRLAWLARDRELALRLLADQG